MSSPSALLTTTTAHLLTTLFATTYVGSLYLSKHARLSFSRCPRNNPYTKAPEERWRDDPDVIKARLAAVSVATLACCAVAVAVVWHSLGPVDSVLYAGIERLGLTHTGHLSAHLVTPLLFLGPVYVRFLDGSLKLTWCDNFNSWQGLRNYIVAPLTEELVFRACVLSVYHLAGASHMRMIWLAPLSFGAAHIHHAWETYNRYGRTRAAAKRAVLATLFQLSFTTLFGAYASFLFLRTGSFLVAFTAHVWCNSMGVPMLNSDVRAFPSHKSAIYTTYILGLVLFVFILGPWTRTAGSLYWSVA